MWRPFCGLCAAACVLAMFVGCIDVAQRSLNPRMPAVFPSDEWGWAFLVFGFFGFLLFVAIK